MQGDNAIKMSYVVHRHYINIRKKAEKYCILHSNMTTISFEFGFNQIETP